MISNDFQTAVNEKRKGHYSFGLGKRMQDYAFGLGKRSENDYAFGLGKRLQDYSFGLGKRSKQFEFGLGKRNKQFGFGLGKRDKPFEFGLGKRDKPFGFGLGKRDKPFGFGLGKRDSDTNSDDENNVRPLRNYAFGLGKRNGFDYPLDANKLLLFQQNVDEAEHPNYKNYEELQKYIDNEARNYQDLKGYDYDESDFIQELEKRDANTNGLVPIYYPKRIPDHYSFGLGKRAHVYSFGLGKRQENDIASDIKSKSANSKYPGYASSTTNKYKHINSHYRTPLIFRRRSYDFGIGKRSDNSNYSEQKKVSQDFAFGLG